MPFTSAMYPDEKIINDTENLELAIPPKHMKTGLRMPFFYPSERHYGEVEGVDEFPDELLIPDSEWEPRIKEMEERKMRMSDIVNAAGLPCKDQNGTSYCWINAPVHCLEVMRVIQNQKMVILSPASAGAVIKNFRNVGGWGKEGLEYLQDHGCCPVDKWPANAIEKSYYTEDNKKIAKKYRQSEWYECRPRNVKQMVSLLLRMMPGASGLNWWGHEITYYEPVWVDGTVAIRQRNSWGMGWGSNGYALLQGSKMLSDDLVAPRVVLAA